MSTETAEAAACLHACQTGCGRPYDIITVQIVDGSTSIFCIPCFLAFAHQIMTAMVEPDNPAVKEVVANAEYTDITYVMPEAEQFDYASLIPPKPVDEFEFTGED